MGRHSLLALLGAGLALTLAGCQVQPRPTSVAEAGRDLGHTYDGVWQGQAWAKTYSHIGHVNSATANVYCPGFADSLTFTVQDGIMTGHLRNDDPISFKTPVSPGGYFYTQAEVKKGGSWFIDGSLPIFTSSRRVVITGVLNAATGMARGTLSTLPADENIGCDAQFTTSLHSPFMGAPKGLPGYTGSAKFDELGRNRWFLD